MAARVAAFGAVRLHLVYTVEVAERLERVEIVTAGKAGAGPERALSARFASPCAWGDTLDVWCGSRAYAVVSAIVSGGRVRILRGWIGAAGD